jgi:hypothetical protein
VVEGGANLETATLFNKNRHTKLESQPTGVGDSDFVSQLEKRRAKIAMSPVKNTTDLDNWDSPPKPLGLMLSASVSDRVQQLKNQDIKGKGRAIETSNYDSNVEIPFHESRIIQDNKKLISQNTCISLNEIKEKLASDIIPPVKDHKPLVGKTDPFDFKYEKMLNKLYKQVIDRDKTFNRASASFIDNELSEKSDREIQNFILSLEVMKFYNKVFRDKVRIMCEVGNYKDMELSDRKLGFKVIFNRDKNEFLSTTFDGKKLLSEQHLNQFNRNYNALVEWSHQESSS